MPGDAEIVFAPTQGVTLGTSLALPRANVTITFSSHTAAQADAFLADFYQAFQRGGG